MPAKVRSSLTFANVTALLALFVALGGSSYAAVRLSDNSVRSKHIRNGQVKRVDLGVNVVDSRKVVDGSLVASDFKAGQLPAGRQGPQGPQGLRGLTGPAGQPGPAGATDLSVRRSPVVRVSGFNTARVHCGEGERATGGGWAKPLGSELATQLRNNRPVWNFTDGVPTGWEVEAFNGSSVGGEIQAYVICASP